MTIQVKTNTKGRNHQEESEERRKACSHADVRTCTCESDKYVTFKCLIFVTEKAWSRLLVSSSRTHLQQRLALFLSASRGVNYFLKYLKCFVSRQPGRGKLQRSERVTTLSAPQRDARDEGVEDESDSARDWGRERGRSCETKTKAKRKKIIMSGQHTHKGWGDCMSPMGELKE